MLSAHVELRELDRKIMFQGIDLAKFNLHYRLGVNRQYSGRSLLYPLVQEAASGCSFAGTVADLGERASHLTNPGALNKPLLKRTTEASLVGQALKGVSFSAELAQRLRLDMQASKQGFSPQSAAETVRLKVNKLDDLLDERERFVEKENSVDRARLELEGRIFKHLRNQLVYQFRLFSCSSREQEWQENCFYILAGAQNYTLMSASIGSIQAFQKPQLTRGVAAANITAGSVGVMAPIVRTFAGKAVSFYWGRKLSRMIPIDRKVPRNLKQLQADWKDLDAYLNADDSRGKSDAKILGLDGLLENTKHADSHLHKEEMLIAHMHRIAQEQSISGPLIEMATLARYICQEVAYCGYRSDPIVANRINLAGRISQASGQAYGLVITPYTAIRGAILRQHLRARGELPAQIYLRQLKELDDMEESLRTLEIKSN